MVYKMDKFDKEVNELYEKLLDEIPNLKETIKEKRKMEIINKKKKIEYNREYKRLHKNQKSTSEVNNEIKKTIKKVMENNKITDQDTSFCS